MSAAIIRGILSTTMQLSDWRVAIPHTWSLCTLQSFLPPELDALRTLFLQAQARCPFSSWSSPRPLFCPILSWHCISSVSGIWQVTPDTMVTGFFKRKCPKRRRSSLTTRIFFPKTSQLWFFPTFLGISPSQPAFCINFYLPFQPSNIPAMLLET